MNKLCFRLVFSAARGMRVAVGEVARSAGKTPGTTSVVGLALAALLASVPAPAQIRPDLTALPQQRPTVHAAPNGVPYVDITTPSAGRGSRNLYRQFDVNERGAILYNSPPAAQCGPSAAFPSTSRGGRPSGSWARAAPGSP